MSVGELAITRSISLVAACCPKDSASSAQRIKSLVAPGLRFFSSPQRAALPWYFSHPFLWSQPLKDPIKRWPRAKRREKSGLRPRIGAPEGWPTCTPGSFWRQVKKKPGTSKAKSEARNSNFEARNKFKCRKAQNSKRTRFR